MIRIKKVTPTWLYFDIIPRNHYINHKLKSNFISFKFDINTNHYKLPIIDIDKLYNLNLIDEITYAKLITITHKQSKYPILETPLPLYEFQKQGFSFLIHKKSAILADEMGTGKTIQTIATINYIFETDNSINNAIIICPSALKQNWKNEIHKFLGDKYKIIIIDKKIRNNKFKDITKKSIIILNYELTYPRISKRNGKEKIIDDVFKFLQKISKNSIIVLDEAQFIRNYKTKTSKSLKKLKAPYKFALTGTPLFNRPTDVYSISQFLGRHDILGDIYNYIEVGRWGITNYKNLDELHKKLKLFMIRRLKDDVLELPSKTIENIFIDEISNNERRELKYLMSGQLDDEGHTLTNLDSFNIGKINRMKILGRIMLLKEYTDHPGLLSMSESKNFDKLKIKGKSHTKYSYLLNFINDYYEDNKIVIFTQFKNMLDIMKDDFIKLGYNVFYLHGGMKEEGQNQIDKFNKSKNAIFISTDAGGMGVNLQTANILINYDLPWSYGKYLQRIDRIHRIGQKRKVTILNIIVNDVFSIEQKIKDLLNEKKYYFDKVINGK